jgi:hypothetical protein
MLCRRGCAAVGPSSLCLHAPAALHASHRHATTQLLLLQPPRRMWGSWGKKRPDAPGGGASNSGAPAPGAAAPAAWPTLLQPGDVQLGSCGIPGTADALAVDPIQGAVAVRCTEAIPAPPRPHLDTPAPQYRSMIPFRLPVSLSACSAREERPPRVVPYCRLQLLGTAPLPPAAVPCAACQTIHALHSSASDVVPDPGGASSCVQRSGLLQLSRSAFQLAVASLPLLPTALPTDIHERWQDQDLWRAWRGAHALLQGPLPLLHTTALLATGAWHPCPRLEGSRMSHASRHI